MARIGILTCSNPEKILKRVRAVAEYGIDALHFSYCMTALCPFIKQYQKAIAQEYPGLRTVSGTHKPVSKEKFRSGVKELLCQTIKKPQTMNHLIDGTLEVPDGPATL